MRLLIGVILLCCWLISGHDAQDFAGGSLAPALKSRLPTPDFLNSENPTQPRVLYAFFGVIPRAIRCTWQSHYERGVLPLRKAGFGVDVFVFNLNVGDTKVDGIAMQQSEISVIPYRFAPTLIARFFYLQRGVCGRVTTGSMSDVSEMPSNPAWGNDCM